MRIAETVTFGGSNLNRAAEFRRQPEAIAGFLLQVTARVLPLWRGKPLYDGNGALGWLSLGHPVLSAAVEPPVFLGLDEAGPRFAVDVSAWQPAPGNSSPGGGLFDLSEQFHPDAAEPLRFAELRAFMAVLTSRDAELAAAAKALLGWHQTHRFCAKCGAPSMVEAAGWQRKCPACGADHFPRTDPVVIMLITRGPRLLLGRSPGWPEGMYSLLAGFIEPGETIEAAVRREVFEESGIRVGPVRYLASQPWPYPASLMMGCQGEAENDELTLDPAELESAMWLSSAEVAQVLAGEHPLMKAPRKGAIASFLISNWLADRLD